MKTRGAHRRGAGLDLSPYQRLLQAGAKYTKVALWFVVAACSMPSALAADHAHPKRHGRDVPSVTQPAGLQRITVVGSARTKAETTEQQTGHEVAAALRRMTSSAHRGVSPW